MRARTDRPRLSRRATGWLRERVRRRAAGTPVAAIAAARVADATGLRDRKNVAACLAIGLDSDRQDIQEAADLALLLTKALVRVPESARALGLRDLFAGADEDAARRLQDAFDRGLRDPDLVAGLLAALTRTGQATRATLAAKAAGPLPGGPAAELAATASAIAWLDSPTTFSGPPPLASGHLRALTGARRLIGEWADYAAGRMLLIEGDARAAAEILVPLVRAHPAHPDWTYHAVTALTLASQAEEAKALGKRAQTAGGDLEAYQSELALLLARDDQRELARAITQPLFDRLPAADRALWEGLAALPDAAAARTHLKVADAFGQPRACLALTVLRLSGDGDGPAHPGGPLDQAAARPTPLSQLLDRAADRSAELGELLRAWAEARDGRFGDVVTRLTPLAADGDPRAACALAGARIMLASRAAAGKAPDRARDHLAAVTAALAAVSGDDTATVLRRTAELMSQALAGPLPAAPEATAPEAAAGSLWDRWLSAVRRVADGQPADLATVAVLADALGKAGYPTVPAVNLTAALATAVRLRGNEADGPDTLGDLVFSLARQHGAAPGSRDLFQVLLATLDATDPGSQPGGGSRLPRGLRAAVGRLLEDRPDAPVLAGPAVTVARFLLTATDLRESDRLGWGRALLALAREHDVSGLAALPSMLPAVCAAATTGRADVPEPVTAAVRALVTAPSPDSPDTLTAARCATAVRDYDSAFRLWVRASGEHSGSLPPDLRAECARAQRYGAAVAQQHGDDLRAVSMLRLAARVSAPGDPGAAATDRRRADTLELQVCAARLLALLVPGTALPAARPGRHRMLEEIIAARPELRRALVSQDTRRARSAWAAHLREHSGDIRLPHALVVLYREHALASPDVPAARDWLARATTLWCLLLSQDAFWDQTQAPGHRAALTTRLATDLLRQHASAGARAFSAGEGASEGTAATHLRLLADCGQGRVALLRRLEADLGLAWPWAEGDGADQVSAIADRLIADWCKDVITDAEKIRDDPEVDLPPGIRMDYEGGIALLDRFVSLGASVPAVAKIVVDWSTKLCRAQQDAGADSLYDKNLAIIERAGKSADQLIAVSTPGEAGRGENQCLLWYFDWRAWLATDNDEKVRLARESLRWVPSSVHMKDTLSRYENAKNEKSET